MEFFFFSPVQNNKLSCFPETIHFHHIRNLLILDENSSINQFLIEFSPEGKRRNWARFAFWLLWVLSLTEHTWSSGIISLLRIKHISTANGALWRQSPCSGEEKGARAPFLHKNASKPSDKGDSWVLLVFSPSCQKKKNPKHIILWKICQNCPRKCCSC